MPVAPAMPRDSSGTMQAAASRLISKLAKAAGEAVACEERDGDR